MSSFKKIIALTVLTVTAAVSLFCLPSAAASSTRLGDVDGNGVVEMSDAVMVVKYEGRSLKLTDEQLKRADYNSDGVVDIIDVVYILKNKAIELPPVEF